MPIAPHDYEPDGPDCGKCPLPQGHAVHRSADGPAAPVAAVPDLPPVRDLGVVLTPGQSGASQAAALTAWPKAGTQRGRVLEDVASAGEYGCTDDELADDLDLSPNTIRPRRLELVEAGWLRKARNADGTERMRGSAQGNPAYVYVLTDAARSRMSHALV